MFPLSKDTIKILKNFADINQGITISPGNVLRTRSQAVIAEAKISETFPREMRIAKLNTFLDIIKLYGQPQLDIQDAFTRITEANGSSQVVYHQSPVSLVPLPVKQKKPLPTRGIEFLLTALQWRAFRKSTQPKVTFVSDGEILFMSDGFSYAVLKSNAQGVKCHVVFDVRNLPLMEGGYLGFLTVPLDGYCYAKFRGVDATYYVSAEPQQSVWWGKTEEEQKIDETELRSIYKQLTESDNEDGLTPYEVSAILDPLPDQMLWGLNKLFLAQFGYFPDDFLTELVHRSQERKALSELTHDDTGPL